MWQYPMQILQSTKEIFESTVVEISVHAHLGSQFLASREAKHHGEGACGSGLFVLWLDIESKQAQGENIKAEAPQLVTHVLQLRPYLVFYKL